MSIVRYYASLLTLVSAGSIFPYYFGIELELALTLRDQRELIELAGASEADAIRRHIDNGVFEARRCIAEFLRAEDLSVSCDEKKIGGKDWLVTYDRTITGNCTGGEPFPAIRSRLL